MIKWRIVNPLTEAETIISLDVNNGNQPGTLAIDGEPETVELIRNLFIGASGAFGHFIRDADAELSAYDADAVLREGLFMAEVIEGAEMFQTGYNPDIDNEDAFT